MQGHWATVWCVQGALDCHAIFRQHLQLKDAWAVCLQERDGWSPTRTLGKVEADDGVLAGDAAVLAWGKGGSSTKDACMHLPITTSACELLLFRPRMTSYFWIKYSNELSTPCSLANPQRWIRGSSSAIVMLTNARWCCCSNVLVAVVQVLHFVMNTKLSSHHIQTITHRRSLERAFDIHQQRVGTLIAGRRPARRRSTIPCEGT